MTRLSEIFMKERGNEFTIKPEYPINSIHATINMDSKCMTFHTPQGEVTTIFHLSNFRYCRIFKTFYLHFDHPYHQSSLLIEIPRLSNKDQTITEYQIMSTSCLPKLGKIGYDLYINNTYIIEPSP